MKAFIALLLSGSCLWGGVTSVPACALVREMAETFEESLKQHPPEMPIDLRLAKEQHQNYTRLLQQLIPQVILLEGDSRFPDCNFIEDTAIVVGDVAVISRMGAKAREGEEVAVAVALEKLSFLQVVHLEAPAKMDGGDILYTGKHLFVGISHRTNQEALAQLQKLFGEKVVGVPVEGSLHLKSTVSLFDEETLIVAEGSSVQNFMGGYELIEVPDIVASNVLRVGNTLIIQEGFPKTEALLHKLCDSRGVTLVKLNMSELIKADGALTCGSILIFGERK